MEGIQIKGWGKELTPEDLLRGLRIRINLREILNEEIDESISNYLRIYDINQESELGQFLILEIGKWLNKERRNKMKRKIGVVSVDSGCLLIGDPCYWLKDKEYTEEVSGPNFDNSRQVDHFPTQPGKGVIVSSGYGDGIYPVIATIKDGRVKEVSIKFF